MSKMPHQGHESLQQLATKHYRYPDKTKTDVLQALQYYRGLIPSWDTFVYSNGEKRELLTLGGTIPVPYKGTTYNIPVCIWLNEMHPYSAPMCFVKPTNAMQVKVSRNVDQTGKVYLPYLHDWKPQGSDLLGLIQVMIIVFQEQPPVYSKSSRSSSSSTTHSTPSEPPSGHGQMPYPTQPPYGMPLPPVPQTGGSQQGYPAYPSYGPPMQPNAAGPGYPPMPNQPAASDYARYPGMQAPFQPNAGSYPMYPPVSMPYPSYPPPTSGNYSSTAPTYASYTPATMGQPTVTSAPTGSSTISEEHIKASLLSAVEDKMKRRLKETFAQSQAEMDVLKRTQDDLNRGKAKLEDIINKMEAEQLELEKNISILNEKNEAISDVITKLLNQEAVDVDEAVVTTAPVYRQLLNAFAEENATEDAIYYLGEALRRGVIDLDVFLKHIRELSRKQFMLRALMQKCREKANLPC